MHHHRHHQQQEEQEVLVAPNDSPTKNNGNRKALIIGISKYDHNNKFPDLDFCENDANEVYNILKAQGYDIPENALLVGRVEWSKMRDEIIDFFTDSTVKPDDTLFFYFSGHGYLDKNTSRTYLSTSEIDPKRPERRGIPFDELATYVNLCNSERITTVLDCCYSSTLEISSRGRKGGEEESAKAQEGEEMADSANTNMRKAVERLIKSDQGKCILASSLEQRSFKMKDQPYSLFTYFLVQGLRGANGDSVDINGHVTLELLSSYVNKKIIELPRIKQKPIRKIEVAGQIILAHYPDLTNKLRQLSKRDYLLQLLKDAKIDEFNAIRRKDNYSKLDFYKVNLSFRDLSHADLRNSNLNLASLGESSLQHATLEETSLLGAHLEGADVSKANVSKADLLEADVSKADLSNADLSYANLSYADLSYANLASSIIIGVKFLVKNNKKHYPGSKNARFDDSTIIDDEELWRHLCNNNAKNVPPAVRDKKELREKLEERDFDEETIERYLSLSSLADSSR